jgi:hypothetical protein
MHLPQNVTKTHLYKVVSVDEELLSILHSVRRVVEALAATTSRSVPTYTDHTVKHMDALWSVADQIITPEEIGELTPAEAFLIGISFYLHDVGMAYAATEEGLTRLKNSEAFKSVITKFEKSERDHPTVVSQAVALAVRQLHADAALELAVAEFPGADGRFLFEAKSVRDAWGATCGTIASSHHWPIDRLVTRFGVQGEAPMPGNRKADLLYVSACLRLIDFAHINRERASSLDRAFRFTIGEESLVHWLAQENIDGPSRDGGYLVYRAAQQIANVDAWWLFYEMLVGLDLEIRNVTRVLDQRPSEYKRLSLVGVKGTTSPEDVAKFIPTSGFLPIEVSLRTGSIDKLVELLAGETLYGPNPMAAVRELIQNARDAVMLKAELQSSEADEVAVALPIYLTLRIGPSESVLEIVDHGVGMTKLVMTDYLISIASNYWSSQFANDFPELAIKGFKNAGKFGIGFLSVFMLGDEVSVESNRAGGNRYRLTLRGVGRRGELLHVQSPGGSGTSIKVKLKSSIVAHLSELQTFVPVYAPTLPHSIVVINNGTRHKFENDWLNKFSCEQFSEWMSQALNILNSRHDVRSRSVRNFELLNPHLYYRYSSRDDHKNPWVAGWPEYRNDKTRLIASDANTSILCMRGLAVQPVRTPGFTGVIEIDSATIDVSRSFVSDKDLSTILNSAAASIEDKLISNFNEIGQTQFITDTIDFIGRCVTVYGKEFIFKSTIPWISQIHMPGNVELTNSATLLDRLARVQTVFITYGLGPWTTMRQWALIEDERREDAIAVGLDNKGQMPLEYLSSHEKKIGPLSEIWPHADEHGSLFGVLLDLVAQAWQVSPPDLLSQNSWTRESSHAFGTFTRA